MLSPVRTAIRTSPFVALFKYLRRRYLVVVGKSHPIQETPSSKKHNLLHLGTQYGGWTFVDEQFLYNSVIISAGLGEDASFDVEFAARYRAKIIIIDPTPRAIAHFNQLMDALGDSKKMDYTKTGKQNISCYDLSNINPSQLILVIKALWNKKGRSKFFEPKNKSHVSHSIVNYQNKYKNDTDYIEVDADTMSAILEEQGLTKEDITLVKLDIEGAEIEVIMLMMKEGFFPKQILVEFDELNAPSKKAVARVDTAHQLLIKNSYVLLHTDGQADFLYYRE